MARRIVILTKTSMENGVGGVPVHCYYLQKVFPEAIHLTCSKVGVKKDIIQKMSVNLGQLAEQKGLIEPDDIVITDGFWGCGVSNQARVIAVCHGTLAGDVGIKHPISQFQKQQMQGKRYVAVSRNAAIESIQYYGVSCEATILNGVDLDIFHPSKDVKDFTVGFLEPQGKIQLARYGKLLDEIKTTFKTHVIKGTWPYKMAEEYRKCSVYLHLSRYEGCSYAVNEALASGLPVIGTPVGLFGDYQDFLSIYKIPVGEILPTKVPMSDEVKKAITVVQRNYSQYKPLEWCQKYCGYSQFEKEWNI
ncbi:MAG: glycosyltransferase, partial [Firmicutes bacterium]|nr:glycosyltransferase [Bacillota bacterium]